jgi:hypothetical protein
MTASTSALVPSGIVLVDGDAGVEQRLRCVDVAAAHREEERRERARPRSLLRVGAAVDESLTTAALFSAGGPHHGRLTFQRLLAAKISATIEKRAHGIDLTRPGCRHQDSLAVGQRGIRIRLPQPAGAR